MLDDASCEPETTFTTPAVTGDVTVDAAAALGASAALALVDSFALEFAATNERFLPSFLSLLASGTVKPSRVTLGTMLLARLCNSFALLA